MSVPHRATSLPAWTRVERVSSLSFVTWCTPSVLLFLFLYFRFHSCKLLVELHSDRRMEISVRLSRILLRMLISAQTSTKRCFDVVRQAAEKRYEFAFFGPPLFAQLLEVLTIFGFAILIL